MQGGILDLRLHLLRLEPDLVDAEIMGQILQFAGAAAAAGQALHPVVGEQQLQGHLPGVPDFLGIGPDLHSLIDGIHAGGDEALGTLDLHHADPAGADLIEILQITQRGDLDPGQICSLNNGRTGGGLHFNAVDC